MENPTLSSLGDLIPRHVITQREGGRLTIIITLVKNKRKRKKGKNNFVLPWINPADRLRGIPSISKSPVSPVLRGRLFAG